MIPENDLNQRLDNTVCRFRGIPYRVKFAGGNQLRLYSLSDKKDEGIVINKDDPDFDISGVPLGYVQINPHTVAYVSRKPLRMWKQGISIDSLNVNFVSKNKALAYRFEIFSSAFEKMILHQYPTIEDARKLLKIQSSQDPTSTEIAISRDIALKYDHDMLTHVFYKRDRVGYIIKDENTVITPNNEMGWVVSKYLSSFNWKVE